MRDYENIRMLLQEFDYEKNDDAAIDSLLRVIVKSNYSDMFIYKDFIVRMLKNIVTKIDDYDKPSKLINYLIDMINRD